MSSCSTSPQVNLGQVQGHKHLVSHLQYQRGQGCKALLQSSLLQHSYRKPGKKRDTRFKETWLSNHHPTHLARAHLIWIRDTSRGKQNHQAYSAITTNTINRTIPHVIVILQLFPQHSQAKAYKVHHWITHSKNRWAKHPQQCLSVTARRFPTLPQKFQTSTLALDTVNTSSQGQNSQPCHSRARSDGVVSHSHMKSIFLSI